MRVRKVPPEAQQWEPALPFTQSTHSEWSPASPPPDTTARARPADSSQNNLAQVSRPKGLAPAVFGCRPILLDERDRREVVSLDLADPKASPAPSLTRAPARDKITGTHLLANPPGVLPCVPSSRAD